MSEVVEMVENTDFSYHHMDLEHIEDSGIILN
jgi:hypothetical protein